MRSRRRRLARQSGQTALVRVPQYRPHCKHCQPIPARRGPTCKRDYEPTTSQKALRKPYLSERRCYSNNESCIVHW